MARFRLAVFDVVLQPLSLQLLKALFHLQHLRTGLGEIGFADHFFIEQAAIIVQLGVMKFQFLTLEGNFLFVTLG